MLGVDWEFAVPLHARNIWIGPGATITATGASEAPEIANASKTRCHDSAESGSPTGGARGASAVMNVADVNSASKLRDANPAQLAGLVDRIASGLSASVAVAGHPPVTVSIGVSHSSLARPSGFCSRRPTGRCMPRNGAAHQRRPHSGSKSVEGYQSLAAALVSKATGSPRRGGSLQATGGPSERPTQGCADPAEVESAG